MPFIEAGDLGVHYVLNGPATAPVVVLSNSLGADLSMWDPQIPALGESFRVLRYDTRGHGRTSLTAGPYTIEQLARDVARLLDILAIDRPHFCGLSMGGLIGMWLAAHAPDRIEKLVLCNTGARIGTAERWNARIRDVQDNGVEGIAAAVVERWFSAGFRERSPEVVAKARTMIEGTPPEGYLACCAAIRDADLRREVTGIRTPTLVITGRQDPATPPADGRFLADAITGARYVELEASHLSNVEAAAPFTSALIAFLMGPRGARR
jgi:3-oxoadipate enol-lactonase